MSDDLWFQQLAAATTDWPPGWAPAPLKSKIYSAVVAQMADAGRLLDLKETKAAGEDLCVFENLLAVLPVGEIRSRNPCRVCHARLLGERLRHAPIFWLGCPYSEFHNG